MMTSTDPMLCFSIFVGRRHVKHNSM